MRRPLNTHHTRRLTEFLIDNVKDVVVLAQWRATWPAEASSSSFPFRTSLISAFTSLSIERRLHNNHLTSLPSGIFEQLAALHSLYVYISDRDVLAQSGAMWPTEALYLLFLFGHPSSNSALTSLSIERALNNNQLTSIPSGIFEQLTALHSLYVYIAD